jgi:hypothetical protein
MCGPTFCSIKVTQEVQDLAAKQNAGADMFLVAEEAKQGMNKLSRGLGSLHSFAAVRGVGIDPTTHA